MVATQIAILRWVLGIRGLVMENHLKGFQELPPTAWRHIIDFSVRTSVEGFAFLYQVRFSTSQARKTRGVLDKHGTGRQGENTDAHVNGKRRRGGSGGENLLNLVRR